MDTAHEKNTAERGTPDGSGFAEAFAKRTGSHICRPVKKVGTLCPVPTANARIASPVVHEAIDSALVLTLADP
jgi:hypothetical protein